MWADTVSPPQLKQQRLKDGGGGATDRPFFSTAPLRDHPLVPRAIRLASQVTASGAHTFDEELEEKYSVSPGERDSDSPRDHSRNTRFSMSAESFKNFSQSSER